MSAQSQEVAPPELGDLTKALKLVLRRGLPVTPDQAPDILVRLRGVQARAINAADFLSCVKALNALLLSLLLALGESEEAQALQILFAANASNRGTTLTARRSRACRVGSWDYDPDHFRKHVEQRLVRDFAWLLHEDSQNYTPRTKYAPTPTEISGDSPSLSTADVNEQEELLSRVWSLVYELRAELIRQASLEHAGADADVVRGATETTLWVVARLLARIHEYLERYGDRILHGDAEYRVEGLIRLAGWSYELSPEQAAELRLVAARAGESRDDFVEALRRSRMGEGLLGAVQAAR
jgi:hypothetical protein